MTKPNLFTRASPLVPLSHCLGGYTDGTTHTHTHAHTHTERLCEWIQPFHKNHPPSSPLPLFGLIHRHWPYHARTQVPAAEQLCDWPQPCRQGRPLVLGHRHAHSLTHTGTCSRAAMWLTPALPSGMTPLSPSPAVAWLPLPASIWCWRRWLNSRNCAWKSLVLLPSSDPSPSWSASGLTAPSTALLTETIFQHLYAVLPLPFHSVYISLQTNLPAIACGCPCARGNIYFFYKQQQVLCTILAPCGITV